MFALPLPTTTATATATDAEPGPCWRNTSMCSASTTADSGVGDGSTSLNLDMASSLDKSDFSLDGMDHSDKDSDDNDGCLSIGSIDDVESTYDEEHDYFSPAYRPAAYTLPALRPTSLPLGAAVSFGRFFLRTSLRQAPSLLHGHSIARLPVIIDPHNAQTATAIPIRSANSSCSADDDEDDSDDDSTQRHSGYGQASMSLEREDSMTAWFVGERPIFWAQEGDCDDDISSSADAHDKQSEANDVGAVASFLSDFFAEKKSVPEPVPEPTFSSIVKQLPSLPTDRSHTYTTFDIFALGDDALDALDADADADGVLADFDGEEALEDSIDSEMALMLEAADLVSDSADTFADDIAFMRKSRGVKKFSRSRKNNKPFRYKWKEAHSRAAKKEAIQQHEESKVVDLDRSLVSHLGAARYEVVNDEAIAGQLAFAIVAPVCSRCLCRGPVDQATRQRFKQPLDAPLVAPVKKMGSKPYQPAKATVTLRPPSSTTFAAAPPQPVATSTTTTTTTTTAPTIIPYPFKDTGKKDKSDDDKDKDKEKDTDTDKKKKDARAASAKDRKIVCIACIKRARAAALAQKQKQQLRRHLGVAPGLPFTPLTSCVLEGKDPHSEKYPALARVRNHAVEAACAKIPRNPFRRVVIKAAQTNPAVVMRFMDYAYSYGSLSYSFHGTPRRNYASILDQGLLIPGPGSSVRIANGSVYGVGIYSSKDITTSQFYARGSNSILVCAISDGKAFHHHGHIAVCDDCDAICPLWIISY